MKAQIGTVCIFCKRPMSIRSRPNLVFDLEKAELRGLAHSTCTNKAKLDWYESKSIEWDREFPSDKEIKFGCKIVKVMQETRESTRDSDELHLRMLLWECLWKTTSVDECLALDRVNKLLDWWVKGPMRMPETGAVRIRELLRERLAVNRA